jgi:hypothetical protein
VPHNPLGSAGAMRTLASSVERYGVNGTVGRVKDWLRQASGDATIDVNPEAFARESAQVKRYIDAADGMRQQSSLPADVADVARAYCVVRALEVSPLSLAKALTLFANDGVSWRGTRVLPSSTVRMLNAVMSTAGYQRTAGGNRSVRFAHEVGLVPAGNNEEMGLTAGFRPDFDPARRVVMVAATPYGGPQGADMGFGFMAELTALSRTSMAGEAAPYRAPSQSTAPKATLPRDVGGVDVEPSDAGSNNVVPPVGKYSQLKNMDPDWEGEDKFPGHPRFAKVDGEVKYLHEELEREQYEVNFVNEDGTMKMVYRDDSYVNTTRSKYGKFLFVMDGEGRIYVAKGEEGKFQHSSFLAGGPVAAAGEVAVYDGKLKFVVDKTGHYKTGQEHLDQFLAELSDRGADVNKITVYRMRAWH